MGDADRLQGYIDVWRAVVAENVSLLRSLESDDWERPTDLPGWTVRSIAAHLAHLESVLAGTPQRQVDVPDAPHITGPMNVFTESGVLARADWPTDQIIDEIESSAAARRTALATMMPLDPTGLGDGFATQIGWTWETLLSNRAIDQWMHQQDVRRAVNRAGGLAGPGGAHALRVFAGGLGYVVGKQVRPPAGTTVVLQVTGDQATTRAVQVGEDGRAKPLEDLPADPTVCVAMDFETFIVLSGGRRSAQGLDTTVTGDAALGAKVLASLAVTP